jgi:hypothetical protein
MAIETDDMDISRNRFYIYLGGNGDYYLTIVDSNDISHTVRVATSGSITPVEVRIAIADLYRKMDEHGINEP